MDRSDDAPTSAGGYHTRPLASDTWADFAALVEANHGIWGGCWCMGFHPEGVGKGRTADQNREAKRGHVERGLRQMLVYADGECVGWCQFGTPAELPTIKNPAAYRRELDGLPDWRIGCLFTTGRHRGRGVARAGVAAALRAIADAGGGIVEAYPEQTTDRPPQRGGYLHTGPEELFAAFGFVRVRRIAKWRWVMSARIEPGEQISPASPIRPASG